jgi:GT2 family glycosyltransferase
VPDSATKAAASGTELALTGEPAVAPSISIVVVTRGPSLQLARLLRSLGHAEGVEHVETLIGASSEESLPRVGKLALRYLGSARPRVIRLDEAPPAQGRNELARVAAAPLLLFLDDDVEVPPDLLRHARETLNDERISAAGGPNLTPISSPEFQQVVGRVLASPLGTGPLRHRYRPDPASAGNERNLILCNLAVRRSAFATGEFNARLVGANENELLHRLEREGARLVYRPELAVYHHRRKTLRGHLRQMAKYGFGRGQMLVRAFTPDQTAYLLPTLALLGFPALAWLAPQIAAAVALFYLVVIAAESFRVAGPRQAPTALTVFVTTHLGYAVGILIGLGYALVCRAAPRPRPRLPVWRW